MDRGLGGDQVEGRQAVRALLVAGRRRTREVWFASDLEPAAILGEIEDLCQRLRVPLRRVARGRLESAARSEAPQGVLARAEPLREVDLDGLCGRRPGRPAPFLVGLDGVTDPQNLGAVLRTAECAGATGVVLPRHRAVHVTPTVTKAAAGAVEHLPIAVVPGLPTALARAKDLGVWTVGLDAGADRSVFDLEVATEPLLLVLGAEGAGLSRLTRERCDVLARIPLAGDLASLNVAAAAAVACFEVARGRLGLPGA
ncbi:MAG TPA: 23S rRNA (guanosine(2251)-2'-O)-methyltransferase RlmB [Acidimicrobiales bacterium]|nr:23S rRNA (guanosine(2251)-2'-O)-methyltransferase RlmB [Acidimicrobiales bacterium]